MLPDVIVVGAGILGVSIAYHLSEIGKTRVVVIDGRCLSAGATGRSGALVRANYDNAADTRLALMSLEVFRNWKDRIGGRCGFKPFGHIEIADRESFASFGRLIDLQRQWGVDIRLIDSAEAKARSPRLRLGRSDEAIAYHGSAGACDPNMANRTLYDAARARGVEFIFHEPVRSLMIGPGRAIGVRTDKRTISAGSLVLATGAWTNQILAPLALDFGFVTRLSHIAVFRPHEFDDGETFPTMLDRSQQAWFRSMPDGCILVGAERGGLAGVDPDRIPDTAPRGLVRTYRTILARRFEVSAHAAPRGSWAGAYMMSPDERPVVGGVTQVPNLFLAAGDSGTSFKIAPAIGLGLAELITHGACRSVDLTSLSPDRFAPETKRQTTPQLMPQRVH
jgi:glycine/D-amino acid oxidase-like deaminating enzyme